VKGIPGKLSRAWVLKGARIPAQASFANLEAGLPVREITEVYDVTEPEVKAAPHFAAQSLETTPAYGMPEGEKCRHGTLVSRLEGKPGCRNT
jgi:uncharacterized protein (DUF433 family)